MHSPKATVWEFALSKYRSGNEVIVLYVVDSRDSSPGRRGFHMAVSSDQDFCGTIGGGVMEHKFVEMARSILTYGYTKPALHRQVHNKKAEKQSGMICSGEQTILLYKISGHDADEISLMVQSLNSWKSGMLEISTAGLRFSDTAPEKPAYYFEHRGDNFLYRETTGIRDHLYIIGGGHCSLALSELMSRLDFYIRVYDDRPGLSTMKANHFANELHILESYGRLSEIVEGGPHRYVVIMTMGYRSDDQAFRALAGKKFRYLGMLGSKSKISTMAEAYRQERSEVSLDHIFAPVGIDIKSETTHEIAVSIAAQIISIRNSLF